MCLTPIQVIVKKKLNRDFSGGLAAKSLPSNAGGGLIFGQEARITHVCVLVSQSCLTLCNPMDCSPPGKNTGVGSHSFSRESSWPRDQTQTSCIAGRFFTIWVTRSYWYYGPGNTKRGSSESDVVLSCLYCIEATQFALGNWDQSVLPGSKWPLSPPVGSVVWETWNSQMAVSLSHVI